MCRLGSIIFRGDGGRKKDKTEGIKLFKKAARRKWPEAEMTLGIMLMRGHDVAQDCTKGAEYLWRASQQGMEPAVNKFIADEQSGKASAAWIRRLQKETGPRFHLPQITSPIKSVSPSPTITKSTSPTVAATIKLKSPSPGKNPLLARIRALKNK